MFEVSLTEKCCTMRVGSSKVNKREYTMGPDKVVLRRVPEEKDIGVIVNGELSFSNRMATKIRGELHYGSYTENLCLSG